MTTKKAESRDPAASSQKEQRPPTDVPAGPKRSNSGVAPSPTTAGAAPNRPVAHHGQHPGGGGVYAWQGGPNVGPGGVPVWHVHAYAVPRSSWAAGAEHYQHPGQDLGYAQAGGMLYSPYDARLAYSNPPSPSAHQGAHQQQQHPHQHPHPHHHHPQRQPGSQPPPSPHSQAPPSQGGEGNRSARATRSYTGPSHAAPQYNQRPVAASMLPAYNSMQPYLAAPYPSGPNPYAGPQSPPRPPPGQLAAMASGAELMQDMDAEAAAGYSQGYMQQAHPPYAAPYAPVRGNMPPYHQQHRGSASFAPGPAPYPMPFAYPISYPAAASTGSMPAPSGPTGNGGRAGWNTGGSWRSGSGGKHHQGSNAARAAPNKSSSSGSGGSGPSTNRSPTDTPLPVSNAKAPGPAPAASLTSPDSIAEGQDGLEQAGDAAASGPLKGFRQPYHPQQGPRSEHVMWVGNVPADSTVDELWAIFSQLPMAPVSNQAEAQAETESGTRGPDTPPDASETQSASTSDEPAKASSGDALDPATESHGVLSIFIISRSNCAFVNYATPRHLDAAVQYFHGRAVRPNDSRCPKMVCRVRKKEDETQSGVQGQRGRGMHIAWAKDHDRRRREAERSASLASSSSTTPLAVASVAPLPRSASPEPFGLAGTVSAPTEASSVVSGISTPRTQTPIGSAVAPRGEEEDTDTTSGPFLIDGALPLQRPKLQRDSSSTEVSAVISLDGGSSGSVSYSSSNSELFRHPAFRERFFILKSLRPDDLERSVETGLWSTQPHNEAVLDRAFRNSEKVYLVFSANQSGSFFGYARMAGPIHAPPPPTPGSATSGSKSSPSPQSVVDENPIDGAVKRTSPSSLAAAASQGRTSISGASLTASGVPSTITEDDEAVALPPQLAAEAPALLAPRSTLLGEYPQSQSPQQLTPSSDMRPWPTSSAPATWPTAGYGHKPPEDDRRVNTLSPRALVPKELPTDSAKASSSSRAAPVPVLTKSKATGDFSPDEKPLVGLGPAAAVESDGVQRRDMALVDPIITPKSTSLPPRRSPTSQTSPGTMSTSLGPGDSASMGAEMHSQQQLAVRAVIHNLRLDEWESMKRANELEKSLQAGREADRPGTGEKKDSGGSTNSAATAVATPRAGSSDSWGKPFRVEWLQTKPLPFNYVKKLRNPWRDNRQIKVSRDGTEVEPGVGRQLLDEWSRFVQQGEAGGPSRAREGSDDEDEG